MTAEIPKKTRAMPSPKRRDIFGTPPILETKLQARLNTPVKPLRKQKKIVTAKEWKFVMELVSGDGRITQKEAALRAGWTETTAAGAAGRMTSPVKSPHIVAAIQEYRAQLSAKYNSSYDRHMRDMQDIRDAALAAGAYGAAVSAEYRRGQALGTIYVDRKEIRVGTIDTMGKDEVMQKLEQLRQLFGAPVRSIIDMTPEEIIDNKIQPDPKPSLLEQMANDEKLRRITQQATQGKYPGLQRYQARIAGRTRDTGLPDSNSGEGLGDGGIEGGGPGEEN